MSSMPSAPSTDCTVVIPVYRNADNVPTLLQRLAELHARVPGGIEVICVVDGSPKSSPPFPVEDGIGILSPSDGSDVRIVTVLVQGNLARPSAFSR